MASDDEQSKPDKRTPRHLQSASSLGKSMQARLRNDRKVVNIVLQKCGWYVTHCKEELIDMRIVDSTGKILCDLDELTGPPKELMKWSPKLQSQGSNIDESSPGVAELSPHGRDYAFLHRNFHTWRMVPPGWKRRLLADAEEISLAMHATRILVPRGGKEPPAEVMNEILVFATDVDLEKQVGTVRDYQSLSDFVRSKTIEKGNRAAQLKLRFLRPDWSEQGLGQVEQSDENPEFMVFFKCASKPVHLAAFDGWSQERRYEFRNNHSKFMATLVIFEGSAQAFEANVLEMFTQAGAMPASSSQAARVVIAQKEERKSESAAPVFQPVMAKSSGAHDGASSPADAPAAAQRNGDKAENGEGAEPRAPAAAGKGTKIKTEAAFCPPRLAAAAKRAADPQSAAPKKKGAPKQLAKDSKPDAKASRVRVNGKTAADKALAKVKQEPTTDAQAEAAYVPPAAKRARR